MADQSRLAITFFGIPSRHQNTIMGGVNNASTTKKKSDHVCALCNFKKMRSRVGREWLLVCVKSDVAKFDT